MYSTKRTGPWMEFHPSINFPFGRIKFIAKFEEYRIYVHPFAMWFSVYIHELIHFFDWIFIYRLNSEKWNDNERKLENRANRIQDSTYQLVAFFSYGKF